MTHRHTAHDAAPKRWTATAWPVHADWGDALEDARREIADLVTALAGATPDAALTLPPREPAPAAARMRRAPVILGAGAHDDTERALDPGALAAAPPIPAATPHEPVVLAPKRSHGDGTSAASLAGRCVLGRYGDIWLRDTGPVFVEARGGVRAVAFRFNGWGGRYAYAGDDAVAAELARLADAPLEFLDCIGEPGALEFDGEETAIASRRCLLNANRNPGLTGRDVERMLRQALGVEKVIWIEEILAGDHTDGHADTLVRFARPGLVVTEAPAGPRDANARARDAVARTLDHARDAQGRRLDVARVAGASLITDATGWPLPATHLNVVFAPDRVIAPLYAEPTESAAALAGLSEVFPDREIVGLSARALITGGGAFHCCTCAAPGDAALTVAPADEEEGA